MRLASARRDGLSLLEVLVSLAIFLMSLVALTALVNTSSNLAADSHVRSRAAQLCRSKLAEMASGAVALEGQPDASVEDETDYHWSAEVAEGGVAGLSNVTVTVTFRPNEPYPIKVSMSRMILDAKVTGSTQDVPALPDDTAADPAASSSSGSSGTSGTSSGGGAAAPAAGGGASKASPASTGAGAKSSGAMTGGMGTAPGASKGSSGGKGK
jgi:Tfp pilus assembly protein PilV